jgi:hypothetical protein
VKSLELWKYSLTQNLTKAAKATKDREIGTGYFRSPAYADGSMAIMASYSRHL